MIHEDQNIEWKESWRDEYLKWICGFANSNGGKLFIGINDDGNVIGVEEPKRLLEDIPNKIANSLGITAEVNKLEEDGKEYIEIVVTPSAVPIFYHGEVHVRSGATKQVLKGASLQTFLLKKMGLTWDAVVCEGATLDSLDPKAVQFFVMEAIRAGRMPESALSNDMTTVLDNLNLRDNEGKLRNAAVLLFGKNPSRFFPLSDLRIGRFVNTEDNLIFHDIIEGDLIRMGNNVVDMLKSKYLISNVSFEGMKRYEKLEIPEEPFREIIYNAIIHKLYPGAHIQMKVYNDKITLWNDGKLPSDMSIEDLFLPHSSKPRNPLIAMAFYKAGFIDNWGRGIAKIVEGFEKNGLPVPVFEQSCGGMLVTINRVVNGENVQKDVQKDVQKELTDRQLLIFNLVKSTPSITLTEMSKKIGVSVKTLQRDFDDMESIGYKVTREGSRKDGKWIITHDNK